MNTERTIQLTVMKCKMISLDTSTTDTGFAIWENAVLREYGNLNLCNIKNTKHRVDFMLQEINNLIKKENPNIIIVEGLTVFNDIKTDSNLSDIIGAIRGFSLTLENCWFDKLLPNEWRNLVANEEEKIPRKREDCKMWDIEKANIFYPGVNQSEIISNDNIADAILIGKAYCNLFCDKQIERSI